MILHIVNRGGAFISHPDFLAEIPIELNQGILSEMKCVSTSKVNQTVGHDRRTKTERQNTHEDYLCNCNDPQLLNENKLRFVACSKCN